MNLYLPRRKAEIPVMIFRSDFRELIRGEPIPGGPCHIAYAPSRLVPAKDYNAVVEAKDFRERHVRFECCDSHYPVTAHLQFRPGGPVLDVPLGTQSGPLREGVVSPDPSSTMLRADFTIPEDAEWMMIWFIHFDREGHLRYDSRYGANYMFRFIEQDVHVEEASVKPLPSALADVFHCRVTTSRAVDRLAIRYRIVNVQPEDPEKSVVLTRPAPPAESGKLHWESGQIRVPRRAVVAFDVIYAMGTREYKEDNQGAFFIVAEPLDGAAGKGH